MISNEKVLHRKDYAQTINTLKGLGGLVENIFTK
jgi:hypothetical protein